MKLKGKLFENGIRNPCHVEVSWTKTVEGTCCRTLNSCIIVWEQESPTCHCPKSIPLCLRALLPWLVAQDIRWTLSPLQGALVLPLLWPASSQRAVLCIWVQVGLLRISPFYVRDSLEVCWAPVTPFPCFCEHCCYVSSSNIGPASCICFMGRPQWQGRDTGCHGWWCCFRYGGAERKGEGWGGRYDYSLYLGILFCCL